MHINLGPFRCKTGQGISYALKVTFRHRDIMQHFQKSFFQILRPTVWANAHGEEFNATGWGLQRWRKEKAEMVNRIEDSADLVRFMSYTQMMGKLKHLRQKQAHVMEIQVLLHIQNFHISFVS